MEKKALITGINGQDGSFLAELLLEKGYEVHGTIRRSSVNNLYRIEHILDKIYLHYADMVDGSSILNVLTIVKPDEIYNLAAQSDVKVSFDVPEYTSEVDALGTLRLLEGVRILNLNCKIYQASTSELYGKVLEKPQNESTPFNPCSPYAVSKLYSYHICKQYRDSYNMFICNGILFNHESERRGEDFVTRKITLTAAKIAKGMNNHLEIGNLDSLRDWGYAKDYVECMYLMLQKDNPDDYVIATGTQHSVRDFIERVFKLNGFDIVWKGSGAEEKGYDKNTGKLLVSVNPKYYRPSDVDDLLGDPSKAIEKLNWNPLKTSYEELIEIMVNHDKEIV